MKKMLAVLIPASLLTAAPASGWWGDSHGILTRASVLAVPEELPSFFRQGGDVAAHCSFDPDLAKNRGAPHLIHTENPEHYLNVEMLDGQELPGKRYDYLTLCIKQGVSPAKSGLLPYAVAEWTEQLAIAFAEYRRWPEVEAVQHKCLVYAGWLAHYAQDMCQPLHLTIHHHGRVPAQEGSTRSRIHENVDSLVERLELEPQELASDVKVAAFDSLMPAVLAELERSYVLVDGVFELEGLLPDATSSEVRAFCVKRARAATKLTASLYLTAWRMSGQIQLPGWLRRNY